HVGRGGLGVVDLDHPVPVVVEHAGVDQLELRVLPAPLAVLDVELGVRKLGLRVVVSPAHPRVRRRGVQVPPVLLDILAVVAPIAAHPEHAFLDDRVPAVPQRQAEAERLPVVADAGHAILAPAVDPRPGVVVGKVVPRRAPLAVVLAYRAPCALRQVRSPGPPRPLARVGLGQPGALGAGVQLDRCRLLDHTRLDHTGIVPSARYALPPEEVPPWSACRRSRSVRRSAATSPRAVPVSGCSPTAWADTPWVRSAACVPGATTGSSWYPGRHRPSGMSASPRSTRLSRCPRGRLSGSVPTSGRPARSRPTGTGSSRTSRSSMGCRAGGGGSATWWSSASWP